MTRITEALACWSAAAVCAALPLPVLAAPAPEAFWSLVGKLASATPQGGQAVARQWPGKPLALGAGAGAAGAAPVRSAPLAVAPDLQTAIAEVRLAEGDAVQLMVLELQGRCITPADLGARYPKVTNADFPQPNNPDPVSYRRVQIDGVRVSFGFRGAAPACLSHVVFNPRAD